MPRSNPKKFEGTTSQEAVDLIKPILAKHNLQYNKLYREQRYTDARSVSGHSLKFYSLSKAGNGYTNFYSDVAAASIAIDKKLKKLGLTLVVRPPGLRGHFHLRVIPK